MSKAEKTRAFIIEKATPVFNKKGYAGTSLSELMEVTGLTKGSIYGNFENKDEVATAVYKYSIQVLKRRLDSWMDPKKTAIEKIIAFTECYRTNWKKMFEKGGCPILNAAIEADDNLPFLKKHVQLSIQKLTQRISRVIAEGQKAGDFRKTVDPTEYGYLTITLLEGGIMLSQIEKNPKHLFAALDRILKIFDEEITMCQP